MLLHFYTGRVIVYFMNILKCALFQAIAVILLGSIVAFAHNAFSVNGINPFRRTAGVTVVRDQQQGGSEVVRCITLDETREVIQRGGLVIDARSADEYAEGHIPGAILLSYYDMGRYIDDVLPLLSPELETVVYCYGEECEESEHLACELFVMGFKKMLVFRGGFEEWVGSDLPVDRGLE